MANFKNQYILGSGVMTRQVRALAALTEDLSSIPGMPARSQPSVISATGNLRASQEQAVWEQSPRSYMRNSVVLNRRFQKVDTMAKASQ